jgi:hypothetical protein
MEFRFTTRQSADQALKPCVLDGKLATVEGGGCRPLMGPRHLGRTYGQQAAARFRLRAFVSGVAAGRDRHYEITRSSVA